MIEVTEGIHQLLTPRLIVLIGTKSPDGKENIIPINNITSVSVNPGMALIGVYRPWTTAENLQQASGFTISVPLKKHAETVWKLGPKFSGYETQLEKTVEFKDELDFDFSEYGPVLKGASGWLECEIVERPETESDHYVVIGKYTKAKRNSDYFAGDGTPINGSDPIMQWNANNLCAAGEVFSIPFYDGDRIGKPKN